MADSLVGETGVHGKGKARKLGQAVVVAREQLIYEIACDEAPYRRYSPWEVLQVQEARRGRMEELKCRMGGSR